MQFVMPDDWIVERENQKKRKQPQPEDQPREQPFAPSPVPPSEEGPDPHEMPPGGDGPVPEMPGGGLPERPPQPQQPQTEEPAPAKEERGVEIIPLVPDENDGANTFDIKKESSQDVPLPGTVIEEEDANDVPPDDAFEE